MRSRVEQTLCESDYNSCKLRKVRNIIFKQFVPETPDCRHKTAISDYFTDEQALAAYIANLMRYSRSTHLKEVISRSASWQSKLKAARKGTLKKMESKLSNDDKKYKKSRTDESADNEGPSNTSSRNGTIRADSSPSLVKTVSVASFVSVHGDGCYDTPPTSIEAAVSANVGNAKKRELILSETRKPKREELEFERLSFGTNCCICSQKRHQSSSSHLKQQQLKFELEYKRIKTQVERYQRKKGEELRQLREKIQLLELEQELCQCSGEKERASVDGSEVHDLSKDLKLDNNSVEGSEDASGFMALMV